MLSSVKLEPARNAGDMEDRTAVWSHREAHVLHGRLQTLELPAPVGLRRAALIDLLEQLGHRRLVARFVRAYRPPLRAGGLGQATTSEMEPCLPAVEYTPGPDGGERSR